MEHALIINNNRSDIPQLSFIRLPSGISFWNLRQTNISMILHDFVYDILSCGHMINGNWSDMVCGVWMLMADLGRRGNYQDEMNLQSRQSFQLEIPGDLRKEGCMVSCQVHNIGIQHALNKQQVSVQSSNFTASRPGDEERIDAWTNLLKLNNWWFINSVYFPNASLLGVRSCFCLKTFGGKVLVLLETRMPKSWSCLKT